MDHLQAQNWLIVIPARYASTRLPGKPLLTIAGVPMVVRTYWNLKPIEKLGSKILVATDHQAILDCLKEYNIPAMKTDQHCKTGSDRVAQVAKNHSHPFILNVQGDEPFININDITQMMIGFSSNSFWDIGTLFYSSKNRTDFFDPNVVKLITSESGQALFFSRSPIPYNRSNQPISFKQHLGVYCFKKESLLRFCKLPQSLAEQSEQLEQLRALHWNLNIFASEAQAIPLSVDTEQDLVKANQYFQHEYTAATTTQ